jgi:hypothetical protein
MDIFAHILWTNVAYTGRKGWVRFWGVLSGVLPDFITFGPLYILSLFGIHYNWMNAPSWVWHLYQVTHSLVIFLFAVGILYVVAKKYIPYMLGWGLHIVIDMFSHKTFYQTPFLFPISDFSFGIISWGNPTFMKVNYSLLVIVYIGLLLRHFALQDAKHQS